jgi:hypothetical protein
MTTPTLTIWIETRTGQRIQLASVSCRTFALLVGEAVWTHICQNWQRSILEVCLLEVLAGASPCGPDTSRILARWSVPGLEKHCPSTSSSWTSGEEHRPIPTLVTAASEPETTEPAEHGSLAAFFPTAEEWASWSDGRTRER